MIKLSCILIVFSFLSCTDKDDIPNGIMKQSKMQPVLWDYLKADAYISYYFKKDSSKNIFIESAALQEKIFVKHHITRNEFYKSYDYYVKHTGLMKSLIDSVLVIQNREKNRKEKLLL